MDVAGRCGALRCASQRSLDRGDTPRIVWRLELYRIVLYECCPGQEAGVQGLLEQQGYEVVLCSDGETLLEAVVERRADAVVFNLKAECQADLGLLQLLRRVAPVVPLILLANEGSLKTQRLVQELRPMYYAISPVETSELHEVVRTALVRRRSRAS